MLFGTVCHYDEIAKFGFIQVPGHERTIFFHNSRQRSYYCDLDAKIYDNGGWKNEPKKGDEVIVYAIQVVEKGPRATYWAQADTLAKAEELLSLMHTYRLQHREGREAVSRLDPKPKLRTLWQGQDLLDLKKASSNLRIERDEFNYYYFEVLVQSPQVEVLETADGPKDVTTTVDTWERCGDPRPR